MFCFVADGVCFDTRKPFFTVLVSFAKEKAKHEWRGRFNEVRTIARWPICPEHLHFRKLHFHITRSSREECVSCKFLHCMNILNLLTMSLAIELEETEERLEKALSEWAVKTTPTPGTVPSTTKWLKDLMGRTLSTVTVLEAQLKCFAAFSVPSLIVCIPK